MNKKRIFKEVEKIDNKMSFSEKGIKNYIDCIDLPELHKDVLSYYVKDMKKCFDSLYGLLEKECKLYDTL